MFGKIMTSVTLRRSDTALLVFEDALHASECFFREALEHERYGRTIEALAALQDAVNTEAQAFG